MSDESTHIEAAAVAAVPETPALPEVTDPETWKRKARARYRVKLPSGNVIEAKRIDVGRLFAEGVLTPDDINPPDSTGDTGPLALMRFWPAARKALPLVAVSPRLSLGEDAADSIDLDSGDISRNDAVQLFLWALSGQQLIAVEVTE